MTLDETIHDFFLYAALPNGGLELVRRLWSEPCDRGLHTQLRFGRRGRVSRVRVEVWMMVLGEGEGDGEGEGGGEIEGEGEGRVLWFVVIVRVRISVETWVKFRVWVKLDSHNSSKT